MRASKNKQVEASGLATQPDPLSSGEALHCCTALFQQNVVPLWLLHLPMLSKAARPLPYFPMYWCRRGQGPWSRETLDCTPVRLLEAPQVAGVGGVAADRLGAGTSWTQLWRKVCRQGAEDPECFAKGCAASSCVAGHLWLFDGTKQRYDFEHCYIAPLCKMHNGRQFGYPQGFSLKADVTVMRIVPHENYSEYRHIHASPDRPPIQPPLPSICSKLPKPTTIRLAEDPLPLFILQPLFCCLLGWSQSVCASAACR
jgi:hypothetical protein